MIIWGNEHHRWSCIAKIWSLSIISTQFREVRNSEFRPLGIQPKKVPFASDRVLETGFWSAKHAKFQVRWTLEKPDSESGRSPRECQKYFKSDPGGVPGHHFDPSRTRSGGGRRFIGNLKSWTLSMILTTFRSRTQKNQDRTENRVSGFLNPPEQFAESARADWSN